MKIAGCIIIMIFSVMAGSGYADREERKLTVLEELLFFVRKFESGIGKRLSFDDITVEYMMAKNPEYIKGDSAEELYKCLCTLCTVGICTAEAERCIFMIDTARKSADAREIEKYCGEISAELSEAFCRMRNDCRKRRGLYTKLGAAAGLLVCIAVI